jgi:hypothetical protein
MRRLLLIAVLFGCGDSTSMPSDAAGAGDDATTDSATPCNDGEMRACGTDVGACEVGVETCSGGAWGACAGGVGVATEVCDGMLDENCDGVVDDGCTNDPFDDASCGGPPLTSADALAQLGSATRSVLATATVQVRTRTCMGMTCDPWSAPASWLTHFLTYSGGVVTRYKDVQADTRLVLYLDTSTPKLSLQHVTFTQGGYPDSSGIVFGLPPVAQMYPVFRAYNVMPQFPSDYEDLELTLTNGELHLGTRCARFTATVFGASQPYTTGYAALYRW